MEAFTSWAGLDFSESNKTPSNINFEPHEGSEPANFPWSHTPSFVGNETGIVGASSHMRLQPSSVTPYESSQSHSWLPNKVMNDFAPSIQRTLPTSTHPTIMFSQNQSWLPDEAMNDFTPPIQRTLPATTLHTTDSLDVATWVRHVGDLNYKLFGHEKTMIDGLSTARECIIDQVFSLALDLVNLLDQLHAIRDIPSPSYGSPGSSESQPYASGSPLPHPPRFTATERAHEDKSGLYYIEKDQSNYLLLLSCYTRLLSIFGHFFGAFQNSINHSNNSFETLISRHLPSITVGSYRLKSNPTMQLLLMIDLAEIVIGQISQTLTSTISRFNIGEGCQSLDRNFCDSITVQALDTICIRKRDLSASMAKLKSSMGQIKLG